MLCNKVVIHVDHQVFIYLVKKLHLLGRLARWVLLISSVHIINHVIKNLMEKHINLHTKSTTYCLQASGQVKPTNMTLVCILKKIVADHKQDWDTKVNLARASTVPMELLASSMRILVYYASSTELTLQEHQLNLLELQEDRFTISCTAEVVQSKRQAWVDRHIKPMYFIVGDWVMVYNNKLNNSRGKLKLRYVGPFQIAKQLGPTTYQLQDGQGRIFAKAINGYRLKPHYFNEEKVSAIVALMILGANIYFKHAKKEFMSCRSYKPTHDNYILF
ncbi:hypothetical protein KP509_29G006300 [Ceratopteris richardii]|uniref:Tf2-1-like SH3-like domain-containing protein n=1 Tax=Ceratopteris richardii TaxID=49495 RepID=A0A8T2R4A8_CERRI|nr:hypothetical protein KP509_29G006300 [Ceratopteris richardii]